MLPKNCVMLMFVMIAGYFSLKVTATAFWKIFYLLFYWRISSLRGNLPSVFNFQLP